MPNFKCKKIKDLNLPYKLDKLEFKWLCKNEHSSLLYTSFEGENFFVQILPKDNAFLIKSHKDTRLSKIGYIQKALLHFKEAFCEEVFNEANAVKKTRLLQKSPHIEDKIENFIKNYNSLKDPLIEIGFGSGRHLLYQAQKEQDKSVIGIEIYTKTIEQVAKLASSKNLNNVLLLKADARVLFSKLPSNSVTKIFLHFPVPWDKQPHRRIISKDFALECLRILKKDGVFELRTDSKEYFDFSLEILKESFKDLEVCKNEDIAIKSKYEDRWLRKEKDIYTIRAICNEQSKELVQEEFEISSLSFSKEKLCELAKNFTRLKFKGEDFFISLQELFKAEDFLVLKLDFGSFNKPQHSFLKLGQSCEFLFSKPLFTKENLRALKKLESILKSF